MALCLTLQQDNTIVLDTSDGPIEIDLNKIRRGVAASIRISAPLSVAIRRKGRDRTSPPTGPPTDPRPPATD